jgi:hypothetical protein
VSMGEWVVSSVSQRRRRSLHRRGGSTTSSMPCPSSVSSASSSALAATRKNFVTGRLPALGGAVSLQGMDEIGRIVH